MTYDVLGPGALDYLPCHYGTSKLMFRGPQRDLESPFVAFLGGSKTYGKFLEQPFPALIEAETNRSCVNFGLPNAGIDVFTLDPFVMGASSRADVTVLELTGAHNMTNRFYSVHPRRNDRFVAPTDLLCRIYPEVDFADFHFTKHMLGHLSKVSPERFAPVRKELQRVWVARMKLMLSQIKGKCILLWFADHAPDEMSPGRGRRLGADPLFVSRAMLDQVSAHAAGLVEVVASDKAMDQGTDGMVFSQMEAMAAAQMLGRRAHKECAAAVISAIKAL